MGDLESETWEESVRRIIEGIFTQPNEFLEGIVYCEERDFPCGYFRSESCPRTCPYAVGEVARLAEYVVG